ncbi:hypothetical protein PYW07_010267 [Mythimna separata]|uniref:Gag-like protein n=1 Tax=Mythimna separata TaxID=271217 RepID=A0AAD7YH75_MYTSE|nr:hypothetical protein PYW07_010267 [Mythimna separata]
MCESNLGNVNFLLSSTDDLVDNTNMDVEDNTQRGDTAITGGKRRLDENSSEEGWTEVTRGRNKLVCCREDSGGREKEERIQVCVTCKNPLPKQFALARLFKTHNITSSNINKIKFVHQNKMLITFDNDTGADEFLSCAAFTDLGWYCQRTSEVGISYGLIKAMELDISDEDLKKNLESSVEIISIKRLNKRCLNNPDGNGWTPSETIRLGFKGSSLPPYVYIYNLRVPVERFVFPVTQCANCWKYGHLKIRCPLRKPVCPKCSQHHENCTTSAFTCVNCAGRHMAFDKICPYFKKEKTLRYLMSEFNCTYRKALTIYVPPSPDNVAHVNLSDLAPEASRTHTMNTTNISSILTQPPTEPNEETTSQVRGPDTTNSRTKPLPKRSSKKQNRRPATPALVEDIPWHQVCDSSDSAEYNIDTPHNVQSNQSEQSSSKLNFWHLIRKIKNIIKSKESFQIKIQQSITIFAEWLTHKIVSSLSFDSLFDLFSRNG